MSLMAMNRAIKKYGTFWGIALGLLMIVGIGYSGMGRNVSDSRGAVGAASDDSAAIVGERNVSHRELEQRLEQVSRQQSLMGQTPTEAEKGQMRFRLLSQVKGEQALAAAAKKAGVTVTDTDIARERDKVWQQNRAPFAQTVGLTATATDADIDKALAQQAPGMTIARLKTERIPEDAIRLQLYQTGLTAQAKQQIKATEAEVRRSYNEIQVRHILIKSGEGGIPDADAKAKAEKLLADIKANPAKMPSLAIQFSDDPGSKAKGGFYDWAPAGQYVPEFTNAALAAGVGKVYPEIVKTSFGYHIIKSEGERPGKDFPKDFDAQKQKYIDQYVDKLAGQKMQAMIAAELPTITMTVTDPMLKAAQLQDEAAAAKGTKDRDAKLELALAELNKIKPEQDRGGAVPLQKAAIYTQMKKTDEVIASYEEALKSSNSVETRLSLAQAYIDNKNLDGAKVQLAEAEKLAVSDLQMQGHLSDLWEKAGDKEKSKAARAKAMEMMQRMMQMQKAQQATIPPGAIPGGAPGAAPPADTAPPAPPTAPAPK